MKSFRMLAFALGVPTCAVVALLIFGKQRPASKFDPRAEQAKLQMAEWELEEFVSITNNEDFRSKVMKLRIVSEAELTKEQEDELKIAIYDFLMAYHVGDYEWYKRFRFRSEGRFNPVHLAYARNYLSKRTKKSAEESLPDTEMDLFREYVKARSGQSYYKGFLTAVALGKTEVKVGSSITPPQKLLEYVSGTTNLGIAAYDPMFVFDRTVTTVIREDGKLTYSTVSSFVKTAEPDGGEMPAPIFIRFYWDRVSGKWLPNELASGNIKQKSKLLLVF